MRLDHLLSKEHLALGSAGHLVGSGVQSQLRAFVSQWFAQGWNIDYLAGLANNQREYSCFGSGKAKGVREAGLARCWVLRERASPVDLRPFHRPR